MIRLFLLVFISNFLQGNLSAQTISFEADSIHLQRIPKKLKSAKQFLGEYWLIQGDTLRYGMPPKKYVKSSKNSRQIDTLIYKDLRKEKPDTIYFNAQKSGAYAFSYNPCCGGFNIKALKTQKYTTPRFRVKLKNTKPNVKYLITLGESGMLYRTKGVLRRACYSAMASNLVHFTIEEIEICETSDKECKSICLIKNGKVDDSQNFEYNIESNKIKKIK
ncbi:MAG: hypothetical protein MK212_21660 [Saprospiraceae bacterium]|nr:hypothetical protein [Saprospiraceae bacterium]